MELNSTWSLIGQDCLISRFGREQPFKYFSPSRLLVEVWLLWRLIINFITTWLGNFYSNMDRKLILILFDDVVICYHCIISLQRYLDRMLRKLSNLSLRRFCHILDFGIFGFGIGSWCWGCGQRWNRSRIHSIPGFGYKTSHLSFVGHTLLCYVVHSRYDS